MMVEDFQYTFVELFDLAYSNDCDITFKWCNESERWSATVVGVILGEDITVTHYNYLRMLEETYEALDNRLNP